jgi:hypothetical protein
MAAQRTGTTTSPIRVRRPAAAAAPGGRHVIDLTAAAPFRVRIAEYEAVFGPHSSLHSSGAGAG